MSNYRSNFDGFAVNHDHQSDHHAKNLHYEEERGLVSKSNRNLLREFLFLIPLAFFLLILFFSITLLIYNHHGKHSGRKEAHSALDYLSKNLNLSPLADLKVLGAAENCPDGFEKATLNEYQGTKSGCVCKDGSVHLASYCWFKSADECKSATAIPKQDINVWGTKSFCIKRVSGFKFIGEAKDCPNTMKVCHPNICVSGTDCPISKVKIAPGTGTTSQFNDTHTLTLERNTDKLPIVSLEAEISQFPCVAHSMHRPSTPSKKFYPLEVRTSSGCGRYSSLQDSSQQIDSYVQNKFYTDNGLAKNLNALPFFGDLTASTDDAKLVSLDRISISASKECQNIESEKISTLSKEIERISSVYKLLGILLIVFSAIGLALVLLFLVLRQKISFLNGRGGFFLILLFVLACVIIATVMFAMHTDQQNSEEFTSIKTHFENLEKNNCINNESFVRAAHEVSHSAQVSHNNIDWLVQILFWSSVAAVVLLVATVLLRKAKSLSLIPDPRI